MKKLFLAWVGDNATMGYPHKITGRHNMHGELRHFYSKKERDRFCEQWSNKYNSYPVPTTKAKAKANYFAVYTKIEFEEHLKYIQMI